MLTDASSPFAAWDGQWFLSIASSGYHATPLVPIGDGGYVDFAFFPAWPLLVRLASFGFLPLEPVSVILANLLFVGAMIPTYRWFVVLVRDERAAARGLGLFAFGPAAYVFSLAYSESLFVLLVAWTMFTFRHHVFGPVLAFTAQLTRLTGSAISLGVAARAAVSRRWGWRPLVTVAAGPAAFTAWIGFVAWLTQDPAGYLRGSPSWYRVSGSTAGLASVIEGFGAISPYFVISLIAIVAVTAASVRALQLDLEAGVYAVLSVGATILFANWVNMPRHALVALPAFAVLGRWMGAGRRGRVVVALAAAGQVILVAGAIRWASFPP